MLRRATNIGMTTPVLRLFVELSSVLLFTNVNRKFPLKKLSSLTILLPYVILTPVSNAAENTTLPPIVVTATRSAQTIEESLASVTVITREEIDNSQAFTVPELLRGVPGLDTYSIGGLGKPASVFLRGTESDHVLVLMDGVKIGSATTSTVAFEHLPLSQVERIEIVRGPRSSLYGSEAIGGVIQIFTRQGKGKKPTFTFSAGMGEDSTYQYTGGVSGSSKETSYSLFANRLQTDGFNDCRGSSSAGCFISKPQPDEDGYKNTSYSVRLAQSFGDKAKLELQALRTDGHTEYDSDFDNEADIVQQVFGLKADYTLRENWLINFNMGRSLDESKQFGNNMPESHFDTTRSSGTFLNQFLFSNENTLIVGIDYQIDEVESSTAYLEDSRNNKGGFLEYQFQSGKTTFNAGLRRDDNEQFGDHDTYNIGLGYPLNSKMRFVASYGTAFKAPSFNELYYPGYGNSNLDPEESKSFELGLKGQQFNYRWFLSAYYTKIDKLIATNFDETISHYFADNINTAKIKGVDFSFNWHNKTGWEFNTNLSWLKPEDDVTGKILPRRAKTTFKAELAEKRGNGRLGLSLLAQSHRYDDAANTQRLGGYGIFNATYEHNFSKRWSLRVRLENILDKTYETARFYNTQGRFWFASFHVQY